MPAVASGGPCASLLLESDATSSSGLCTRSRCKQRAIAAEYRAKAYRGIDPIADVGGECDERAKAHDTRRCRAIACGSRQHRARRAHPCAPEGAGFVITRSKGSHRRLVNSTDTKRAKTIAVHKGKDFPKGKLADSIEQAGLTEDEFLHLL